VGSGSIEQIPTSEPSVYAFAISGELSDADVKSMATTMNTAFEVHDEVNMLLLFDNYQGSEAGAGANADTMKAQWKALSNVNRYAVVGAPNSAETMISMMDKIIPVDAETFESSRVDQAWAFVGARPV